MKVKVRISSNVRQVMGAILSALLLSISFSLPVQAAVKAEKYQAGFWEGNAYLNKKTHALKYCVMTATDNRKNFVWLVRRVDGLYLGFTHLGWQLKPKKKYRGSLRIDALWAADVNFTAKDKMFILVRIDNLPGVTNALRRGEQMFLTFHSYNLNAPLDQVPKVLTILESCRLKYGPPSTRAGESDGLVARIGRIKVGKARYIKPKAPTQRCDYLAAQPSDPARLGKGVEYDLIDTKPAVPACQKAIKKFPDEPRFHHQLARAFDKAENYKAAANEYQKAVSMGYLQSFYALGLSYNSGEGVKKNPSHALALFKSAFDAGHIESARQIGNAFRFGKAGPIDYKMAAAWYALAARKGDADSEVALAVLYDSGKGVPEDHAKVAELAHSAALHKQPFGMIMLGMIYSSGSGVKMDKKKALDWFRLAHAYGHPQARQLALPLAEELGVGTNLPPIIADVEKLKHGKQTGLLSDPVMDLTIAAPPVIARPLTFPILEYKPISISFTGLPAGGMHWLSLATPTQAPNEFINRVMVAESTSDGISEFKGVAPGLYEIRVIENFTGDKQSIIARTSILVGAATNKSKEILTLMDNLDRILPRHALSSTLREFSVDTATAPTPENIRQFADALAGEAVAFFDMATKKQDTSALGIARVLAEAARSLAPKSVKITLLAVSTLTTMPEDYASLLDAEQLLRDALVFHPDSTDLRLNLAVIASDTGSSETALDALVPLLKDTQAMMGDPVIIAKLTKLFIETERFEQGITLIRKLTPKGPKGDRFRFFQAALMMESGKVDEARALLRQLSSSQDKQIAGAAAILLKEMNT